MRAPMMALAAVCLATTGYLIVAKYNEPKPLQPTVKRSVPVPKKINLVIDSVRVSSPQLHQTDFTAKKRSVYSMCNVTFIQPTQVQVAELTGYRDTVVRFDQGTQIAVHPSDFVSERTGEPIAGPVKLQVGEYYTMDDILLHNLSTTTGEGLLETNGMINIQAFAANGDACKLRKDRTLEIRFPVKNEKPGMELFSGVKKEDGTIIWQPLLIKAAVIKSNISSTTNQKPVVADKKIIDTSLNALPEFTGGLKGIEKNINSVKNPFPIKNTNAMVIADFNVDKDGRICWVGIINGTDEEYNTALSNALYRMPDWQPALKKGREVLMTMRMAVSFNVTNPRLLRFWSCVKSPDQTNYRIDKRYGEWSQDIGGRHERDNNNDDLLNYYAFTSANLGWINCDRFYNSPAPQTQLYVAEPPGNNTSIKLIFHTIKSVLNATVTDGKYCFGKVPKGAAVTIVALKGEKPNLQMAIKSINISGDVVSGFEFKKVTPEDIKSTMQQFNQLPGAVVKN